MRVFGMALAAGMAAAVGAAEASIVRIEGDGTIGYVGPDYGSAFAVGQPATFLWEYDTRIAPTFDDGVEARFPATTRVELTFNGQTFRQTGAFETITFEYAAPHPTNGRDQLQDSQQGFDETFAGLSGLWYGIVLTFEPDTFDSPVLPTTFSTGDLTDTNVFALSGKDESATALRADIDTASVTITEVTPIPVPPALPMLGLALAGLAGLAARRPRARP